MTIQRMGPVGIVVEDLAAATAFLVELGMEVEREMPSSGDWVDRVIGIQGLDVEITILRTPDGHGRVELTKFVSPGAVPTEPAPPNAVGIRRIVFSVDDIAGTVARLRPHGAELLGEIVQHGDLYRLCYLRGPEGIIVVLAEQLASS